MADTDPAPPAPDSGSGPGAGDDSTRLGRLEDKVDALVTTVGRLVSGGGPAPDKPADKPGPDDVAAQVRAELERADRERAEQTAKQQAADDAAQLRADVAALKERAPAPPVRRATKLTGWS